MLAAPLREEARGAAHARRRAHGHECRRFRVTTQSTHRAPIAPNHLDRQFTIAQVARQNRVWAADLTYIPTREGWLYLAVLFDLASGALAKIQIDQCPARDTELRRHCRVGFA